MLPRAARLLRAFSRRICAGLLACAAASAAQAQTAPEIEWLTFNLPPLYIAEGPLRGQGVLDLGLDELLLPRLTGYRHRHTEVPIKRAELMLKSQGNICAFGLLKNPAREATMLFTVPILPQLSPGVVVRRADAERLAPFVDPHGQLQLRRAVESGAIQLGMAESRSYGAVMDKLLLSLRVRPNVQVVSNASPSSSLMQMTLRGRIDAAMMAAYEPRHFELSGGLDVKPLKFLPVAEQPRVLMGYAACSRSPQGRAVVQRINEIFSQPEVKQAMSRYYERWLDDDSKALARAVLVDP
jgi:uncharacterized protein (TIGR02285 family)